LFLAGKSSNPLKLRTNSDSNQQQQQQGPNYPGNPGSAEAGPAAAVGGSSQLTGVVLLSFTCSIPDRQRLLNAYELSPYPQRSVRVGS